MFLIGMRDAHGEDVVRAMAFVALVLWNLDLALANRSITSSAFQALLRPNPALAFVLGVTVLALTLALGVPWLRGLFGFASLSPAQLIEPAAAALASLVVVDLIGAVLRRLPSGGSGRGRASIRRSNAA
jgi:P-type Ca2+ transporter type 2C